MNNSWKRFLSLLLAMVMVLSLGVTGFAEGEDSEETPAEIAEGSIASTEEEEGEEPAEDPAEDTLPGDGELEMEEISPDKVHIRKLGLEEEEDLGEIVPMDEEDLNTVVRASIFLEDPATLSAGYSAKGVGTNSAAIAYRDGLKARQAEMTAQIESVIGHELNVHWNLTLAVNAISADLSLGEMVKVRQIPGVRSVERENRYLPMDEGSISEPETANTSENMTGATTAWAAGYTGAGSKIAVIDTGIDTSHQSFAAEPFTYSVGLAGASGELMTQAQVRALASQLNSGSGNYVSAKIPYGYNYVDGNTTINHLSDSQGNHGSHVAGIAAANRYVGSAHQDAAATVGAVGMAPDAQLFVMKVFGAAGGAYDSDYMVAIEDAMVLGADACNLSLGSADPGWSFDNSYQSYLNGWADGGHNGDMVLTISAGNSYAATDFTDARAPYIEDVYTHTGGSPGSFVNSLCVAAAQNTLTTGTPMLFNGSQDVFYYESTGDEEEGTTYSNPELSTIVGSYNYVYIDAVGTTEDYSAVNAAVSLSGKVVLVNRGDLSFSEKGNNAKSYNPKALIIANNMDGTILMNLADFTGSFPMVSITLKDANQIKAGATAHSVSGITYYTGSMQVTNNYKEVVIDRSQATITDFSSWGVPGSLLMKPEITAPGGDIYSVYGTAKTSGGSEGGSDKYVSYSGTSMAAPHMAGLTAVLAERIREEDLKAKNPGLGSYSIRAITQSLMMSTATPMAPDGEFLSILQQGAGLAEVSKAASANSVIMMDPSNSGLTGLTGAAADGKVKVELGDDPARKGDYSFGFTVYNLSDEDITFDVRTEVFTQAVKGEFMSSGTAILDVSATKWWAPLDGSSVPNLHDVNRDGRTDELDATAILDYVSGEKEEGELDLTVADLDEDELISSQDAYLLLGFTAEQGGDTQDGLVPAHGSRYCAVRITLPGGTKGDLDGSYPGGAFLEGFTTVKAVGTTKDGGVYTDEHSIPILGFYGSWTDASMFETTSYIDGLYGSEQLPYSGNSDTNYMRLQMNGSTVKFTGNPYQVEGSSITDFPGERLAINANTSIQSIAYNLIRSAGTTGFAVSRLEDGEVSEVLSSSVTGNEVTGLWYHVNQASWYNTGTKLYTVNKTPASYGLAEGDAFRIGFYAIPEYNAMLVNDSYNTGTSGMLNQAGFNALLQSGELGKGAYVGYDFVVDNTDPQIVSATLNGTTITVSAEDNQNLAYVAVLSLDGETVYAEDIPAMPTCELSFDASEAIANAFGYVAVFAGDYAGNESAMAVKVNDNTHVERTVFIQTDTLEAGQEYVIANTKQTGSGMILGHTGTTVGTNAVTVKASDSATGGRVFIDSKDVASTSVWTAGSGVRLQNGNYYLRRNSNTGTTLQASTTNSYNTWQYGNEQLRFTDRATYLVYANNRFTLSTAAGNVYIFQKVEQSFDVDPYSISGVTVTPGTAEIYKGSTLDLTAKVVPLTAGDRSVSWSSSNPSVATVDASGKVTGVSGSASGMSAVITATANGDSTKKAECTVTVYSIEKNLNGIVWDEAGAVYFSGFNSGSLPTWNKLHNNDLGVYLMNAMMFNSSTLYASVCDPSGDSPLYTVNRSSYALTEYGMNYVAPFGMARGMTGFSSQGYDFFVYGFAKYLILGGLAPEEDGYYDEETETFIGNGEYYTGMPYALLDLSTTDVGDAYVCAVAARTVSAASASYYFLDETGKIWQITSSYNQGFTFGTPTLVVDTGIGTSFQYQSLYYDGTYLYWSHFADNETELIIIVPSTGTTGEVKVYNAGNFGEGIWPVGGLYVNGSAAPAVAGDEAMAEAFRPVRVATREQLMTPDVMERLANAFGFEAETPLPETEETPEEEGSIEEGGSIAPVEPIIEPVPAEDGQNSAYTGGLTAFRGTASAAPTVRAADPQAAGQTFTVDIAESQASHNGVIAVEYDPTLVSFVSWADAGNSSNLSVHPDDKGVITIAYANKDKNGDDIAPGTAIATLNFSVEDPETLPCNVIANAATIERNDELELNEWTDVIIPGEEGHDWGEPSWTWAADLSEAEATFVCRNDASHTATVAAEVSSETADGVTTYTATAVFQGQTYTDTKTDSDVSNASNITSTNVNFAGKLDINVFITLSEEIKADPEAYATITFLDETRNVLLSEMPVSRDRVVAIQPQVDAAKMRVPMTVQLFNGAGQVQPLTFKDTIDVTAGFEYAIIDYLRAVQESPTAKQTMKDLAAAAELYGIAAQVRFSYKVEQLTAEDIAKMEAAAQAATIPASFADVENGPLPAGITRRSKTVVFEADNTLRQIFYLNDADLENYTFTVDGVAVTPQKRATGQYFIEKADIGSGNLSKSYTFGVSDGTTNYTVQSSVLSYAYDYQEKGTDTAMLNLCKVIYLYSQAADAHFAQ